MSMEELDIWYLSRVNIYLTSQKWYVVSVYHNQIRWKMMILLGISIKDLIKHSASNEDQSAL